MSMAIRRRRAGIGYYGWSMSGSLRPDCPIKDNHPLTKEAIVEWFAEEPAPYEPANLVAQSVEKGHGRIVTRRIETTTALNECLDWPGLSQAFKLTHRVVNTATGEIGEEACFGITSLSPDRAVPDTLLSFIQQHWTIENRLHWVKDVTLDEDRCQLRKGYTHQLMALFRNLALSILRFNELDNVASTLRTFAAQPDKALALITTPIGER
nr:ISAs1 family transposase [Anaerolineae bacterium]